MLEYFYEFHKGQIWAPSRDPVSKITGDPTRWWKNLEIHAQESAKFYALSNLHNSAFRKLYFPQNLSCQPGQWDSEECRRCKSDSLWDKNCTDFGNPNDIGWSETVWCNCCVNKCPNQVTCPEICQSTPTPTSTTTPLPTPSPTPTSTSTPTPVSTNTPTPTFTPTPTPSPEPEKTQLTVKIKFQGISQTGPNQTARLIFKQQGQEKYRFDKVNVTSSQSGIYSGTITDLNPGTYDIYLKGWAHLQKKFGGVTLNSGENIIDWTAFPLLAGDANGDNLINIQDFGVLVRDYLKTESPADFNLDGMVNIQDFLFIAENYLKEGE